MKVLQVINSYALSDGGAQRLAQQFHRAYLARGIDSHLLELMRSAPPGLPNTHSLGFATPRHPAVLPRLLAFLRRPGWRTLDLIHVHLFPAQLLVPIAARLSGLGARLVTTEHSTFNLRRAMVFGRAIDRYTYRPYAKIACINADTGAELARWLPEVRGKLVTVLNGVALAKYATAPRRRDNTDTPIVISAGRLTAQKNYETAIRAVGQLRQRPFEYRILGTGERRPALEALVRELGLEKKIAFYGFLPDVAQLLGQADVFLMPSHWEGFGLAVAEAMAAGLPVVASDVPGLRDVVAGEAPEDPAGLLVDPGSVDAVAAALGRLLDDPELRRRLGDNARRRAARFDIARTIEAYLGLYDEVLGPRPVAR